MIEFVYRENAKETGSERKIELPKNVRQIGDPEDRRKIYIEDYVITYLRRLAGEETLNSRVAILLGHSERMDGLPYLFIRGAVGLKKLEYTENGIPFTDETWAEVYGAMKEYFADLDILGWYLSLPGYPMELGPELLKIHVNYFGGVDKVLLVSDSSDEAADFFAYENEKLTRQRGYTIFYERNEAMQRYMIETGDGESIDEKEHFEDRAIKSFRTIVQEKKEQSGQKRVMTFLYMASTFLVMVVLVIGITLINNYEKMTGLETALRELTDSLEQQDTELKAAYADSDRLRMRRKAQRKRRQQRTPKRLEKMEQQQGKQPLRKVGKIRKTQKWTSQLPVQTHSHSPKLQVLRLPGNQLLRPQLPTQ